MVKSTECHSNNCMNCKISEQLILHGGGEYNIEDIRDIKVTESYLGLDQSVRNCQNEEPYYNCTTQIYMDSFLGKCKCLPLNMRLKTQV